MWRTVYRIIRIQHASTLGWDELCDLRHSLSNKGLELAWTADKPIEHYRAVSPRKYLIRRNTKHHLAMIMVDRLHELHTNLTWVWSTSLPRCHLGFRDYHRSVNVSLFVNHPQVHYTSVSQLWCITKTVQLHGYDFDILVVVASGNVARQKELQLSPPLV